MGSYCNGPGKIMWPHILDCGGNGGAGVMSAGVKRSLGSTPLQNTHHLVIRVNSYFSNDLSIKGLINGILYISL